MERDLRLRKICPLLQPTHDLRYSILEVRSKPGKDKDCPLIRIDKAIVRKGRLTGRDAMAPSSPQSSENVLGENVRTVFPIQPAAVQPQLQTVQQSSPHAYAQVLPRLSSHGSLLFSLGRWTPTGNRRPHADHPDRKPQHAHESTVRLSFSHRTVRTVKTNVFDCARHSC